MADIDILNFIDKHATPMFTLLGILFGLVFSPISTWIMKKLEFINQAKLKRIDFAIEFEKKNLIEPVLLFLKSDLKLMTSIYQKGLAIEQKEIEKSESAHILDMSMVSARLGVYVNDLLIKKFDEFTRKRIQVGFSTLSDQNKNIHAHNKIKEAEALASEIIAFLKDKMEKLKT